MTVLMPNAHSQSFVVVMSNFKWVCISHYPLMLYGISVHRLNKCSSWWSQVAFLFLTCCTVIFECLKKFLIRSCSPCRFEDAIFQRNEDSPSIKPLEDMSFSFFLFLIRRWIGTISFQLSRVLITDSRRHVCTSTLFYLQLLSSCCCCFTMLINSINKQ